MSSRYRNQHTAPSALGAFCGGLLAGLIGSAAQSLFFRATKSLAPNAPSEAFQPPPDERNVSSATEKVARRSVEGLARRGPLRHPNAASQAVHFAFGSAWGGLYGLWAATRGSTQPAKRGAAFGIAVWAASDNLLLPAFRLAGWPWRYPLKTHAYAAAAHMIYGATVAATFGLVDELTDAAPRRLTFSSRARQRQRLVARIVDLSHLRGRSRAKERLGLLQRSAA